MPAPKPQSQGFFIQLERQLPHTVKEGIAKTLVYYFALKESREFHRARYQQHPHPLDRFQRVFCIAHRGFSGIYPENTLLAFEEALKHRADVLELDIQLSQDGEIVVCHDPHLQRLAGCDDFIRDLPYQQIQKLDVGSWKSPAFAGLSMPTLAELFEQLPPDTLFLIEIKHEATRFVNWDLEKKLLQLIRSHGREKQVVLAAFNPMIVNRLRKLAPSIATLYLITQQLNPLLIWLLHRIGARYLSVDLRYLNPRVMRALHKKGLRVLGYTLNQPDDYHKAVKLGLAGIITDHPERLQAFLKAEQGTVGSVTTPGKHSL